MLEENRHYKLQPQEGIVVSDQDGLVIAWRDGLARRFSWERLRQLSLSEEMSGQSLQQQTAVLAQPSVS